MSANRELILAAYDAWNRRDLDAWLAACDPDVVIDLPGLFPDFEPEYRGHDGLRRFWEQLHEPWESFRIDVESLEGDGDLFVADIRFRAKGAGSGANADMRYGQGFRLRDGRATLIVARGTPEEAARDLRVAEPARREA